MPLINSYYWTPSKEAPNNNWVPQISSPMWPMCSELFYHFVLNNFFCYILQIYGSFCFSSLDKRPGTWGTLSRCGDQIAKSVCVCPSVTVSLSLSVSLSVSVSLSLFISLSPPLLLCLPASLTVFLSLFPSFCLCLSQHDFKVAYVKKEVGGALVGWASACAEWRLADSHCIMIRQRE